MQIKPDTSNFEQWIPCVPPEGDLIFLSKEKREILEDFPFAILSREQVLSHGLHLWKLNSRSWYAYALNRSDYCVWLPAGALESFNKNLKSLLLEEQIRLQVPTVVDDRWITSHIWCGLSDEDKVQTLQRWWIQNEVQEYTSIEFEKLPNLVQRELVRIGYDKWVNRFAAISGPNCFATTAGALASENKSDIRNQWMQWPQFESFLGEQGYVNTVSSSPQIGDVLIFTKDKTPIHAAYYLGEGLYFEKPGQDFYEPYRIGLFQEWKSDWPESALSVWRKA